MASMAACTSMSVYTIATCHLRKSLLTSALTTIRAISRRERKELTMRSRAVALVIATAAVGLLATTGSAAAGQGETVCTWGGTPAAPTGVATFSPGITNTTSTGTIQLHAT